MVFASSPLLMLRQFILVLTAAAGLVALAAAGIFWLGVESTAPIYGLAVLAPLASAVHVAIKGRVRVELTDDAVIVSRPLETDIRLPRREYAFSARVVSHSVNLVPTETERVLIADNGGELREIDLPNLAKKPFDAIMAALLKDRILAEAATETGAATPAVEIFTVPREAMLGDFRRLIAILAVGGLVLSAGFVGFIAYILATRAGAGVPAAPLLAKTAGFCALMFVGLGLPVFMTYRKRERGMPATVRIAGDAVDFGDEYFPLPEIRRIVATPPDYTMGNFVANRFMTVWTDRRKTVFNFGVRAPGGVWKTTFGEYGDLCAALERAAARAGFEFVYDL